MSWRFSSQSCSLWLSYCNSWKWIKGLQSSLILIFISQYGMTFTIYLFSPLQRTVAAEKLLQMRCKLGFSAHNGISWFLPHQLLILDTYIYMLWKFLFKEVLCEFSLCLYCSMWNVEHRSSNTFAKFVESSRFVLIL